MARETALGRLDRAMPSEVPRSALGEVRLAIPLGELGTIHPVNLAGDWRGLVTDRDSQGNWVDLRLIPDLTMLEPGRLFVGDVPIRVKNGDQLGDPSSP